MDEAVTKSSKATCGGGLIRNHNEEWCRGFFKYVGSCNIEAAEAWGILEGAKLAINKGFTIIEIQSNNKMVIVKTNCKNGLINQIQKGDTLINFVHVFREANGCADTLAK